MKYFFIILGIALFSCNSHSGQTSDATQTNSEKKTTIPSFNADSAYQYTAQQVEFGPRVPNTDPHKACAAYLTSKLESFGADVIVQSFQTEAFDGTVLNAKNIIGQYQKEKKNRIMLFAHWDSRPFADMDANEATRDTPILGASDGASGVGILLEIARQIQMEQPKLGIDLIFFDAEDYGTPSHKDYPQKADTWCLGSQYWGKNPHARNYQPRYGILLDMVGAIDAQFYIEQYSYQIAPYVVEKIWNNAAKIGYGNYFIYQQGGMITDDHVYVNRFQNIPCVDIIQFNPTSYSSFGHYWHTHNDNMDIISVETLKAVGQTLIETIYTEK